MSRTITIADDLYDRLDAAARARGLSIDQLLRSWPADEDTGIVDENTELGWRRATVARIEALRAELDARYGEMPDSTELVREDRAR